MSAERLDKWLWAARFFKSRTQAAAACDGGKVDVNGEAAKPARAVRPGDLLHVSLRHGRRRIARVKTLSERRGGAAEAALLYEDLTPPPPPREERPAPTMYRPPGAGRPTKRERRLLERITRR
jgi:ribosome-associated heat shock protein Hsp15